MHRSIVIDDVVQLLTVVVVRETQFTVIACYLCSIVENILCDVVLQVGRNTFRAHRNVLAVTSGYLMELFTEDETTGRSHYKLPNIDFDAFEILINYAYTSRCV